MRELSYNKEAILAAMRERGEANFREANSVKVTVGATAGYLIGDLFDLEVTHLGSRKVSITIPDIAEMRDLIGEARSTAPANHKRSFSTFLTEMETTLARNAGSRRLEAQNTYAYLLMNNFSRSPREGEEGYVQRDYLLSNVGLDELIVAYNRTQAMLMGGFSWRGGRQNGCDIAFLSSNLYDGTTRYSTDAHGFSVKVTAMATVTSDGEMVTTHEMEIVSDHSMWTADGIIRDGFLNHPHTIRFSTTDDLTTVRALAVTKLQYILVKSADVLHNAITMRERELRGLGFDIQITYNEAMAS